MLTISRGIIGFGTGGEYPAASTSASEAANEYTLARRGPIFILVTNLPLSFGGPFAVSVFLIVLQATGMKHLNTLWRVTVWDRLYLAVDGFLFSLEDAEFEVVSEGRD